VFVIIVLVMSIVMFGMVVLMVTIVVVHIRIVPASSRDRSAPQRLLRQVGR
jgi:hypothetical protein